MDVASSLVLDNLSIGLTSFKIAITVILYLIFAMKRSAFTQFLRRSGHPEATDRELCEES